jgi:hypothetical protein
LGLKYTKRIYRFRNDIGKWNKLNLFSYWKFSTYNAKKKIQSSDLLHVALTSVVKNTPPYLVPKSSLFKHFDEKFRLADKASNNYAVYCTVYSCICSCSDKPEDGLSTGRNM